MRSRALLVATTVLIGIGPFHAGTVIVPPAHAEEGRPPTLGETAVFARVPAPGQPEGILVDGERVYVSGAGVLTGADQDWPLWAFDRRTGSMETTQTVPRSGGGPAMGLAGMARDAEGRLYVVDMNGKILRTTGASGRWEEYATIPTGHVHAWPAGTMPVDMTFDEHGNAYVIDFNFPGIWRIPPGGKGVEQWFTDPRLLSPFGGHGIRIGPDQQEIYFTLAVSEQAQSPAQGIVYALPIDQPDPARLREVFRYPPGTAAAGIAFGASGKLYVALWTTNQISVLRPDGSEEARFPSPDENAEQEIPYDVPANLAFDGNGSLLVTNVAAANPDHWAILSAYVDDTALPLAQPRLP